MDLFPGVNIGSDIIVGFCGEQEEDFNDTVDLIQSSSLKYLHVFPYSPRKGTKSYSMPDTNQNEKLKRAKILRDLSRELYKTYLDQNIGLDCELLWETEHEACSKNYIHVFDPRVHKPGSIEKAKLKAPDSENPSVMRIF